MKKNAKKTTIYVSDDEISVIETDNKISATESFQQITRQLAGLRPLSEVVMTKKEAMQIIKNGALEAKQLSTQEAKTSPHGFQDEKGIIHAASLLSAKNKPAVQFLEKYIDTNKTDPKENKKLKKVIAGYQNKMADVVEAIEKRKKYNTEKGKSINIPIRLNTLAKEAKALDLERFITDCSQHHQMELKYLNHALRWAADKKRADNIPVLVKHHADILGEGPTSRQIPLHHAIMQGSPECVAALLRAKNTEGYFDPISQLEKPDKDGETPLDKLDRLPDFTTKRKIKREIILALVDDNIKKDYPDGGMAARAIASLLDKKYTLTEEAALKQQTGSTLSSTTSLISSSSSSK